MISSPRFSTAPSRENCNHVLRPALHHHESDYRRKLFLETHHDRALTGAQLTNCLVLGKTTVLK
jgi:hypothetical protein